MSVPPYLNPGDTVALAAPARKISQAEILPAERWLKSVGFNVFYDDRLFAEEHQFAGSDEVRAQYFQELLDCDEIKAIWCVRGGYGSARIIDKLDFSHFRQHPKWVCGYSDITVFHSHVQQNFQTATLHATMPINVTEENTQTPAVQSFLAALTGKPLTYEIAPHPLSRQKVFSGILTGGNLSMLYSLVGSPSDIDTTDKVLFIEDLDEYLYHIDRMMLNLKRSGKLTSIKALLVGHLSDMHDNTVPFGKTAEEIVADHCRDLDIPLIFNVPAGHLPDNRAFRMGCKIEGSFKDNKFIINSLNHD
ncbi:MAG: LD-carboxypeptidase [Bacteroidales bacterium]|nr:LD-carboxypeptidase [Bacteroidales bacterium]